MKGILSRKWVVGLGILAIITLFFYGCPDNRKTEQDCGPHQIEINNDCQCEPGYHWNDDLTECLLDTTSHNFVWTVDTLGGYDSYLHDVRIVDENNIWVVGNIKTDSGEYSASHWDGTKWEMLEIYQNTLDLYSILYFDDNNIWVTSGIPYHWNGDYWERYHLWDMGVLDENDGIVKQIWGKVSSDIYFIGDKGTIVHYDGTNFSVMESSVPEEIIDIWGVYDNQLDRYTIWACGFSDDMGSALLQMDNDIWSIVYRIDPPPPSYTTPNKLSWIITSVWTDTPDTIYCASAGRIYHVPRDYKDYAIENFWYNYYEGESITSPPATEKLRGNNRNDLMIAGWYCDVRHFNGRNWYKYEELISREGTVSFFSSLDIKGDLAVCVGTFYSDTYQRYAIVALGRR